MSYSLKSVIRGSSIYTIGEVLTKASGFFLIPLFTRILTPADYGIIGFMQFILQILAVVLMFGFHGAQTRFFYEHKDNPDKQGSFLFTINLYLIFFLLVSCLVLTIAGNYIWDLLGVGNIPYHPYFLITIWTVFFQLLNQMVISYNLAKKNYRKTAVLQGLLFLFITLFSIILIIYFKHNAEGRLLGLLLGQILFFVLFYPSYCRNFKYTFRKKYLKYALLFGLPIVFHLLSGKLLISIDTFILERYVSMHELGIYTIGYQIGMVMNAITISFNKAWQPNYYELMKIDNKNRKKIENRRIVSIWLLGIGGVCLFGILWTKELIYFLTPSEYHLAIGIIPFVLLSYLINGLYMFAGAPLFYYKKTIYLPFLTGFSALVNIILNLIFIPLFGIYGAVYATLIAYSVQSINTYFISKKYFNPEYNFIQIGLSLLIIFLSIWIVKIEASILLLTIIKIIYFAFYLLFIFFVFKKDINIKSIKKGFTK